MGHTNRIITFNVASVGKRFSVYTIIFTKGGIERFINFPHDYNMQEIVNVIMNENKIGTELILNQNGLDGLLYKTFEQEFLNNKWLHDVIVHTNPDCNKGFSKDTNHQFLNLAINSSFDEISKIEFNKMKLEFENFVISEEGKYNNTTDMKQIDESMGMQRAICLLQYLSRI